MNDCGTPPGPAEPSYDDEAAVWHRLAALPPSPEDVDEVRGCWDIGEQEGGLSVLLRGSPVPAAA
ncbi:hypothetical protein J2Z21_000950 [Streptomyces griseochromogenes]|uniref:Uncharacterized protein n=1 Tax=Streptomyces griseochromogenes TaxID=68214 RepID=A0A1B1AUQ3_9ACTN|nr:hypothetical protein [Streptomyces griseochromogenes]ANP50304.1 hypothetical protein AVL59_12345 [Streptomyces griseochromogenes]MBP2048026.1 hypothetical protein [Streptomyces griseochromogenes]